MTPAAVQFICQSWPCCDSPPSPFVDWKPYFTTKTDSQPNRVQNLMICLENDHFYCLVFRFTPSLILVSAKKKRLFVCNWLIQLLVILQARCICMSVSTWCTELKLAGSCSIWIAFIVHSVCMNSFVIVFFSLLPWNLINSDGHPVANSMKTTGMNTHL